MTAFEPLALAAAMLLLALERVAYIAIWRRPAQFREWCARLPGERLRSPVHAVHLLFLLFKLIQGLVFAGWFWIHGGGRIGITSHAGAALSGVVLIAIGQTLNIGVFARLGTTGVFYGNRFGHAVTWVRSFPFSIVAHPQYVGTVLTIWGVFLMVRYPAGDWMVLPLLETLYYAGGGYFEQDRV